jgi:hypothetical protein
MTWKEHRKNPLPVVKWIEQAHEGVRCRLCRCWFYSERVAGQLCSECEAWAEGGGAAS